MPELPEITNLAQQMDEHLRGKTFSNLEIIQPKCLNIPVDEFAAALTGAVIQQVANRGKWILTETDRGWLLLNLGMGGEIFLTNRSSLPEKRRLIFDFSDRTCLSVNFWWFGYAHYAPPNGLSQHEMVGKLGPNALDVSQEDLKKILSGRRGNLKSLLLDQSRIAGIGNAYIHDILFMARLHPLRKVESLSDEEIHALHQGIYNGLHPSLVKGGAFYETDLFGKKGGFLVDDIVIGYRESQPCPNCGTAIQKIKTGGTSSFICPTCQV